MAAAISYIGYSLYFIVITILASLTVERKKQRTGVFLFFSFGLLGLIMSLRSVDVGNDTRAYYNFFQHISQFGFDVIYDTRIEYLYRVFVYVVSKITHNYIIFQLLSTLVTLVPITIILCKTSDKIQYTFILFWLMFATSFFTIQRQAFAIVLFLAGCIAISKKTIKGYVAYYACVLVAYFFHNSAIILLFFPVVLFIRWTKRKSIICFALAFLLSRVGIITSFFTRIAGSYYLRYLKTSSGYLSIIYTLVVCLIVYCVDSYVLKDDKDTKNLHNSLISYDIVCWSTTAYVSLSIMSATIAIAGRCMDYFTIPYILYITSAICKCEKNNKRILLALITILSMSVKIISFIYRPEWNSFFPFKYYWQ